MNERARTKRLAGVLLALAIGAIAPGVADAARARPVPVVVTGTAISPSQVQLAWSASGPAAIGYNVLQDGAPAHHMLTVDGAERTVVIHNLRASSSHAFSVRAYDAAGTLSVASNVLTLTTPAGSDAIAPTPPSNLRTYDGAPAPSRVSLMWNHGGDDVGIAAYEIHANGVQVAEMVPSVWYPGAPDYYTTVRHLTPGTTQHFTVRTRDEAGNVSLPSNEVVVALPSSNDVTPPSAPVITFATNWANCGFFDLSWNASVDDVDAGNQLDYEIYEDGMFIGIWLDQVHEGAFGRHRYEIRGVDRSGNASPPSNAVVLDHGLGC